MGEPMKFEAGMVMKWRAPGCARYAIRGVEPDYVRCWRLDNDDPFCGFAISAYGASFEVVSPAPRAGDTWTSGESVATIYEPFSICGKQLGIRTTGEPFVGDVVAVARKLWDGGYRRADATHGKPVARRAEHRAPAYATLDDLKARGLSFDELSARDPIAQALVAERANMPVSAATFASVLDEADKAMAQAILGPSYRAFTVTLPPLSAGSYRLSMDPEAGTAELRGAEGALPGVTVLCQAQNGGITVVRDNLPRHGNVAPLASLAYAVAAVFAPCDRATSRQHVDAAVARLRGEPFAGAIEAALVGVSECANLTPAEIAATIAALRHWEARRPFDRDLSALARRTGDRVRGGPWNRLQFECTELLRGSLGYAPVWDYDVLWFLYERARSSR